MLLMATQSETLNLRGSQKFHSSSSIKLEAFVQSLGGGSIFHHFMSFTLSALLHIYHLQCTNRS